MVWLKKNHLEFEFHNFKKDGLSRGKIMQWLALQPMSKLLNKKSTSWRMLSATDQQSAETEAGAVNLMQQYPNLIKRPVAEISGTVLIGFDEHEYRPALNIL